MITGLYLIGMGYKPSKYFKTIIDYANTRQGNMTEADIRKYADSIIPKIIEPHLCAIGYHFNIEGGSKCYR